MTNLEYLESAKKKDRFFDDGDNYKYRKIKALEIIAESLIGIDDKLNSFINDGKVINVDTHEII